MAGYLDYFGFSRKPFGTTPDPDMAFATREHEIALLRVQDGVEQQVGLCYIKGTYGVGKSTIAELLRRTWAAQPGRYTVAYISDPSAYTPAQFLRLLLSSFGLEASRYIETNKNLLRGFLLDEHEAGRIVIVLLDEAQTISPPNMATLLALTNEQIPAADAKLLQIVLFALPNMDRKLSYQPALSSRIARRGTVDPLILEDTIDMIRHRVTLAGGDFDTLFPLPVHRAVYNATEGIPRKICILCDNALLRAYAAKEKTVTSESIALAIRDCEFGKEDK